MTVADLFNPEELAKIGAALIQAMKARFADATDANDSEAPAYSPRGPVYLPLQNNAKNRAAGRNLKGRFSLSRRAAKRGQENIAIAEVQAGQSFNLGGDVSRSGNSLKFPDYSAMKQFLGKSGNRDLELSGKMLGAITVAEVGQDYVEVGFTREEERAKMQGNQRWADMWGISDKDGEHVGAVVDEIVAAKGDQLAEQIVREMGLENSGVQS
jgi:hypothetical protein